MLRASGYGRTEVVFFHQGVPVSSADVNKAFWQENYWEKLPTRLAGSA